jgi:hypothetical protein
MFRTALGAAFSLALVTCANASTWSLHLSGIDDSMDVLVNGTLVYTCSFGQTCSVKLSKYLVSGRNTLELRLDNTEAGWTFNYKVLKDGEVVLKDSCGKFNISGCMGDQQDSGTVYDLKINILN